MAWCEGDGWRSSAWRAATPSIQGVTTPFLEREAAECLFQAIANRRLAPSLSVGGLAATVQVPA